MLKVTATLALVGLLTSPVVAQTRLFCKFTGIEITECSERDVPAAPILRDAGCCDHVVLAPLGDSKVTPDAEGAVTPVLVALPALNLAPRPTWVRVAADEPILGAGPPLFVQHRAFLI